MKRLIILVTVYCFAILLVNGQTINFEKSIVTFKVNNMVVNSVKGTFKGMSGIVNFDPNNLADSKFDVCIDATTINTGNKKRDEHLRASDYFHTDQYPDICIKSTKILNSKKGYVMYGELSMHGVTRQVEISFIYSDNAYSGTLKLKRLDYKVGEDAGSFMVGNRVEIKINLNTY